ncbi:MAG: DegT/DnrJ/EryC1/StrS aminotransferase family protein [Nanoarchaeota archaeon]|nr:DegT/DnrJ/EryC1/StrS aminotransferase family protein [Nanoarchaeota archaeon]
MERKIPLTKPYITDELIKNVTDVLKSGYLTEGPVTKELEKIVAKYTGVKYAISFTSNTTGMETVLRALKIGEGDEVIIPNYTYPATANVVYMVGAEPVLVDVDKKTANIDYSKIEEAISSRTKAIIPVSLFGNPLDYDKLNKIKEKYNLFIIEDSACSLGSSFSGKKTGSLADASIFSFHPRKFITTGEGGMVTTNNFQVAEFCNSYKHFGMTVKQEGDDLILDPNEFSINGTNYKLSNVQSAIGLSQMKVIDKLLEERLDLAKRYDKLLEDIKEVEILKTTDNGKHSYQSYCILIQNRDSVMGEMRRRGVEVQIGSIVLNEHLAFKNTRVSGVIENSKILGNECLALPFYNGLTEEDQITVINELKSVLKIK